jgi:Flp pilus assembly protein TadB
LKQTIKEQHAENDGGVILTVTSAMGEEQVISSFSVGLRKQKTTFSKESMFYLMAASIIVIIITAVATIQFGLALSVLVFVAFVAMLPVVYVGAAQSGICELLKGM